MSEKEETRWFNRWMKQALAKVNSVRDAADSMHKTLEQHKTPECMGLSEMIKYMLEDEKITAQFEKHYRACPDYCQKMVKED